MNYEEIIEKLKKLEYHQKLLLKMAQGTRLKFDYLVVEKSLSQAEARHILTFCENMSIEFQKQKAEGLVYFHPLYKQLNSFLEPKLTAEEVIEACLAQDLYVPLMQELKKYIER